MNIPCYYLDFTVLGEVAKLVVESNAGAIILGTVVSPILTPEVVVSQNSGGLMLCNDTGSVDVRENSGTFIVFSKIHEHLAVKDNKSTSFIDVKDVFNFFEPDFWFGK